MICHVDLLKWMREAIPPLDLSKHKGQAGKICVIGGSKEYTGAPYFSGISALLCGADLVHVICPEDAAPVIKSYSPELIVHPILHKNKEECCRWLAKMDAVVIGPGLGRDNIDDPIELVKFVRARNIPLVIDADGLHLIGRCPSLISGYSRAVLTPNVAEVAMLQAALVPGEGGTLGMVDYEGCAKLAAVLGNVTVLMKGRKDLISDGTRGAVCESEGSPRRCGGQGDLLGGAAALMLHWCLNCPRFAGSDHRQGCEAVTAAYGACLLSRSCARSAFADRARSMTTTDMIGTIGRNFSHLFGP